MPLRRERKTVVCELYRQCFLVTFLIIKEKENEVRQRFLKQNKKSTSHKGKKIVNYTIYYTIILIILLIILFNIKMSWSREMLK